MYLPRDASQSAVMSVCRPSVRPSVCHVQVPWSHRLEMEYFENNFTAVYFFLLVYAASCIYSMNNWLNVSILADPNMGDLVQRKHPQNRGWNRGGVQKNLQYLWNCARRYQGWHFDALFLRNPRKYLYIPYISINCKSIVRFCRW